MTGSVHNFKSPHCRSLLTSDILNEFNSFTEKVNSTKGTGSEYCFQDYNPTVKNGYGSVVNFVDLFRLTELSY